jgi:hypothetical protein
MKVYYVYAEGSVFSGGDSFHHSHVLKAFRSLEKANAYKAEIEKDYPLNRNNYAFRHWDFFDVEEVELDES